MPYAPATMSTLESLGYGPFFAAQMEILDRPELTPARVLSDGRDSYHLIGCRAPLGELSGKLRHDLKPLARPVAGDWLAVEDGEDLAVIRHVLDRRTILTRRAAGSERRGQNVAANVDVFFVVTSVYKDFSVRRIERYLAAVWDSGATPAIVLNKIDLGGDIESAVEQIRSADPGVAVALVSAATGEGIDSLRTHIEAGATVGLVGSSGVGKSSIINRLLDRELQPVRELRRNRKGRHTTTRRELVVLPGGGVLLDTPGMRELGLFIDEGGVDAIFKEIAALAEACRFTDCSHSGEPGCAVESAAATGELDPSRLASYRKLQKEIAAVERLRSPEIAGRAKRRWKSIHKEYRAWSKASPKHRDQ